MSSTIIRPVITFNNTMAVWGAWNFYGAAKELVANTRAYIESDSAADVQKIERIKKVVFLNITSCIGAFSWTMTLLDRGKWIMLGSAFLPFRVVSSASYGIGGLVLFSDHLQAYRNAPGVVTSGEKHFAFLRLVSTVACVVWSALDLIILTGLGVLVPVAHLAAFVAFTTGLYVCINEAPPLEIK